MRSAFPLTEREVARFWSYVDRGDESQCWLWRGPLARRNYGVISLRNAKHRAHRVSWEITHGRAFPDAMLGCHSCDNPQCVNPHHIWPGTMSDNIRDARRKGRVKVPTESAPGWQARKRVCVRGHPLSGDNLFVKPSGYRQCRACQRMHNHRYQARAKRAARAATEG